MPMYEFKCSECGQEYEELVAISAKANPPCPICKSTTVERKMSVCASAGGAGSGSGSSCGSSGFS